MLKIQQIGAKDTRKTPLEHKYDNPLDLPRWATIVKMNTNPNRIMEQNTSNRVTQYSTIIPKNHSGTRLVRPPPITKYLELSDRKPPRSLLPIGLANLESFLFFSVYFNHFIRYCGIHSFFSCCILDLHTLFYYPLYPLIRIVFHLGTKLFHPF